jgi:hypothetical protein
MRRALANLLLVIWIAGSCPALLSASSLPACCRANGKHHCMQPSPGDGFQAQLAGCPYRHLTALTSQAVRALPVATQDFRVSSSQSLLAVAQSPHLRRQHVDSIPERGPPSTLS